MALLPAPVSAQDAGFLSGNFRKTVSVQTAPSGRPARVSRAGSTGLCALMLRIRCRSSRQCFGHSRTKSIAGGRTSTATGAAAVRQGPPFHRVRAVAAELVARTTARKAKARGLPHLQPQPNISRVPWVRVSRPSLPATRMPSRNFGRRVVEAGGWNDVYEFVENRLQARHVERPLTPVPPHVPCGSAPNDGSRHA